MPRQSIPQARLLTNASATGAGFNFAGGTALMIVLAGSGGATVSLEILGPNGSTWVPVQGASTTANAALKLDLPDGTYRGVVTGGTAPAGVFIELRGVP